MKSFFVQFNYKRRIPDKRPGNTGMSVGGVDALDVDDAKRKTRERFPELEIKFIRVAEFQGTAN
jgi:hypothetical protein